MDLPKVLITNQDVPKIVLELLNEHCEVIQVKEISKEAILSKVKGVDGIFYRHPIRLDKDIIEEAGPSLKVIACMSTGVELIDTDEVKKRGIKLANTAGANSASVAELTILLILAASRRLQESRWAIERDEWKISDHQWMLGNDLKDSTIGIVGLGSIGQGIITRLKGFEIKQFLYTGHKEKAEGKNLGAKFVTLESLLQQSDFVIMACPITSETKEMCNDDFFSRMKDNSVFVNVSRGAVVQQDALIRALKRGKLFAAGLDVMTPEPLPPDHELLTLPNVVLMPHIGVSTRGTVDAMAKLTVSNILRGIKGEDLLTPVLL